MNRLVKKEVIYVPALYSEVPMTELSTLDAADVKSDRCPLCKNTILQYVKGFKICDICGANFKVFNNKVYVCDIQKVDITNMMIDTGHY